MYVQEHLTQPRESARLAGGGDIPKDLNEGCRPAEQFCDLPRGTFGRSLPNLSCLLINGRRRLSSKLVGAGGAKLWGSMEVPEEPL